MVLNLFSQEKALSGICLDGDRVYMRVPRKQDCEEWVAVKRRCAPYEAAFTPVSSLSNLDREGYFKRLSVYQNDWRDGMAHVVFIFMQDTHALAGGLTINNIVRGAGQMATLGYWLDEERRGQGLMPEAVGLACDFAFGELGLHRMQAGCLPHNKASRRVLEKCGFAEEGFARKYIKIAGEWQDHVIYAKISENDKSDAV